MLKKTITYTDFNDVEHTEDFYFNLTKAELAEMALGTDAGFEDHVNAIVEAKDGQGIIDTFKRVLRMSYGVRSEDGKRFSKAPHLFDEFLETEAFSVLFMELISNEDASSAFIRGVVPADMAAKIGTQGELIIPQDHLPAGS